MNPNNFFPNIDQSIALYKNDLLGLLKSAELEVSTIKPSDWAMKYRNMTSQLTAVEGMFDYWNSPYSREIIDCLSEDCPVDTIAIMKGAQIGFSAGVIENGFGWIASQNPGNTLILVGHEDNLKDSLNKIEQVIDSSGIRHLMKSPVQRARNSVTGDTGKRKDYPGGYLKLGLTNHKSLRNMTMRYGFIDDFEAMKGATKEAGSTVKMIEKRFSAMSKKKKLFFISTPELKDSSNIEPEYLKGDQRRFHIPCPCCNEKIILEWEIESEKSPEKMAGITWEIDDFGKLIKESVGYICYKCDGFFDDRDKMEWLNAGEWIPTAVPVRPSYRSYHISSLYAPTFMDTWEIFVRDYLECTPIGRDRDEREESEYKTFVNTTLGKTYEYVGKQISANKLQKNTRKYIPSIIPEKLSLADGNGKIVMITCGSDANGTEDDGRLDYEIVAYSESGATYSIYEGSVGTFIPKDKHPEKRQHWSYQGGAKYSIWKEFEKILTTRLKTDTKRSLPIFATGLDSGYMTNHVYQFSDVSNGYNIYCLKGDPGRNIEEFKDYKTFRKGKDRGNLYMVESNYTKTLLAIDMDLNWDHSIHEVQPFGFMNFPTPTGGAYQFESFFAHFESETKMMSETGKFVWRKKAGKQNHKFDCRLYANVARDIILQAYFKSKGIHNGTWADYCKNVLNRKKR